jgi:hypothetical protein
MKTHIKILIIIGLLILWIISLVTHLMLSGNKEIGGLIDTAISLAAVSAIGWIWNLKKNENKE